jgi:hypothetical protein
MTPTQVTTRIRKADADRLALKILQARLQGELAAKAVTGQPGTKRLMASAAEKYGWENGAPDGTHPSIIGELRAAFLRGVEYQEKGR